MKLGSLPRTNIDATKRRKKKKRLTVGSDTGLCWGWARASDNSGSRLCVCWTRIYAYTYIIPEKEPLAPDPDGWIPGIEI